MTCRSDSYIYSFTALVGSIFIFVILLKVLTALRKFFLRESYDLPKRYGTGTWALITAPTSATGHGFAVELAKLAFNIILVGRDIEKLNKMRDLLILRHNVKVQSIDFCHFVNLFVYIVLYWLQLLFLFFFFELFLIY